MIRFKTVVDRLCRVHQPEGPLVAALPMYDWPERRAEVDGEWEMLREALRIFGIKAPEKLARCNADLPPVPGGIRDATGRVIAPDPATLPPDEFNFEALWQHPNLLFAQTCHGPLEQWLKGVTIIGQDDYSGLEGGDGELYSSAIITRRSATVHGPDLVERLKGLRLAYNVTDSMSGYMALERELESRGAGLDVFSNRLASGGHRKSIRMVAQAEADVAAIDCKSWALALLHEPSAQELEVVDWTAKRKGLPFITGLKARPD